MFSLKLLTSFAPPVEKPIFVSAFAEKLGDTSENEFPDELAAELFPCGVQPELPLELPPELPQEIKEPSEELYLSGSYSQSSIFPSIEVLSMLCLK